MFGLKRIMNFITLTSGIMEVKILVGFTAINGAFAAKIVLLRPFPLLTVAAVSWLGKHVDD